MRRRSETVTIKEIRIAGEDVRFVFRVASNDFIAAFRGEEYVETSFNALVNTVRKKGKEWKPAVSIPVTKIDHAGAKGNDYTDYTVTGVHSGNGNVLLRNDKTGEISQEYWITFAEVEPKDERVKAAWYTNRSAKETPRIVKRLSSQEREALSAKTRAAHAAEEERDRLQRSFKIALAREIEIARKRNRVTAADVESDDGDPRLK